MKIVFLLLTSSWLPPSSMPVPRLEDPGAPVASAPACAITGSGAFLLVWEEARGEERRIVVRRREPDGTWAVPTRIDTGLAAQSTEPRIAVVGESVSLVWQETTPDAFTEGYFRRSSDGGRTWEPDPVRLSMEPAEAAQASMISVAANSGGVVLAAWEDRRSGIGDIFSRRSIDFGASWESLETRLDVDGPKGSAASYHPQVVLNEAGNAGVVWWDESAGLSDVHLRTSGDEGGTWKEIIRLDPGNPGETASRDVSIASREEIMAIAWEDETGGIEREIIARISTDTGATWSAESPMGRPRWAGAIEDPHIAIDGGGRAQVIWVAIPAEEKPRQGERAPPLKKSRNRPQSAAALFHAAIDFDGRVLDPIAVPAAVPQSNLAWIGAEENTVWTAWVGTRIDAGSMEAAFSTDSGRTWRAVGLSRAQNPEETFVPVSALAGVVDASGALHLVWVEGRAERERLRFVKLDPGGAAQE